MKKLTHLLVAGGIAWVLLALSDLPFEWKIAFGIMGAMMGMLPDGLDFSLFRFLGHRNRLAHNVLSPLWIVIAMLGYTIGN
jgi:Na+/pantothenate symporter